MQFKRLSPPAPLLQERGEKHMIALFTNGYEKFSSFSPSLLRRGDLGKRVI